MVQRWSVEVTFEEARAQLGLETQRQWSDLAIARPTLVLLGLFSIVTRASGVVREGQPDVLRLDAPGPSANLAIRPP